MFKQTWTSLCERFDQTALEKYKEQAATDSDAWIQQRLLKAMSGMTLDQNILSLFQYQLQTLYQLYFYSKELNHTASERDKKIVSLETQIQKQ